MQRTYQQAIKAFGHKHTYSKTIEELIELALALVHYQDGKIALPELVGEIADVELTVGKLKLMLTDLTEQNIEDLVLEVKQYKIGLLQKEIKKMNDGRGKKNKVV
mgnify:CR=1 FL=1